MKDLGTIPFETIPVEIGDVLTFNDDKTRWIVWKVNRTEGEITSIEILPESRA